MKKHIVTAALLAAAVAVTGLSASASAAKTKKAETVSEAQIVGGWTLTESAALSKNPGAKSAWNKAVSDYSDGKLHPVAVLGSQVVSGTNYCILCRRTSEGAFPEIQLVYVYEDLSGNAEITGFQTLIGKVLPGGFEANKGKFTLSANKDVYAAYKKAAKKAGVSYKTVAYLGDQVVAGSNYLILCRDKKDGFVLVTVYADLSGNAEITRTEPLALGNFDE